MLIGFHTVKAVLALIGADWGCQTGRQAALKNQRWQQRAAHVGIVAGVQGISALTADVSWNSRAAFVLLNAISHYIIDSWPLPKVVDQSLHIAVAVGTAPLLRSNK